MKIQHDRSLTPQSSNDEKLRSTNIRFLEHLHLQSEGRCRQVGLTTLLASYLHYICKCKVLVVTATIPNGRRIQESDIKFIGSYFEMRNI